jgi:hypothetical protein
MFDHYFESFKTFVYDVSDTISRSASLLLRRGITVRAGSKPCTNGRDEIRLPQAMKRRLSADEIDFVRYLLHHEAAHIKHSGDPFYWELEVKHSIHNALEDVRIERIESNALGGSAQIFGRGHQITQRIWDETVRDMDPDKVSAEMGVVNAIFGAFVDPARRNTKTGIRMLDLCMDGCREFFPEIDQIGLGKHYPDTNSLVPLVRRIWDKLSSLFNDDLEKQKDNPDGTSSEYSDALQSGLQERVEDDAPTFGGGMVEQAAQAIMTDKKEDRVDLNEVLYMSSGGKFYGLSASRMTVDREPRGGVQNWEWGRRAAAGATPLINLLRGQSRHGLSSPKDQGVRLVQRRVPDFMQGLTNNILRKKILAPKIGTSVVIMVDDSGSMAGSFDIAAWRSAAMIGHACERAQIKTCIGRFSDQVYIDKQFPQSMASVRNRFGLVLSSGTDAEKAIQVGEAQLSLVKTQRKVFFFLCDGSTPDCREQVRSMTGKGIEFYPILLGQGACQQALPGGRWDVPGVARIVDPSQQLSASLINRLCSVCK